MFKNMINKIDNVLDEIRAYAPIMDSFRRETRENNNYIKKIFEKLCTNESSLTIIKQQQDLIEKLITDKYLTSESFECVVFVPYRGTPVVVKDGKRLDNDHMKSFCVDWAYDNRTAVTINND